MSVCLKVSEGQSKSAVAILRIRTLAAFANAFRVRPLNHSGRIALEATSELNFLWFMKSKQYCSGLCTACAHETSQIRLDAKQAQLCVVDAQLFTRESSIPVILPTCNQVSAMSAQVARTLPISAACVLINKTT